MRGVDAETFSPRHRSPDLRAAWKLDGGALVLAYVGRVSREKGLAMLPDVERRLCAAGVEHRWVIVGDGPYRQELERRLDNAVFLGTLLHADVARPLASATCSCSRAARTRPATSCSRRRRADCPFWCPTGADRGRTCGPTSPGLVCRGGRVDDLADAIVGLASTPRGGARWPARRGATP